MLNSLFSGLNSSLACFSLTYARKEERDKGQIRQRDMSEQREQQRTEDLGNELAASCDKQVGNRVASLKMREPSRQIQFQL